MSTNTQPERNPSGHDEYRDDDTIFVTGTSNGSVGIFHATAECWALKKAGNVLEKTYRQRPIRSELCQFCHGGESA